MVKSSPSLNPGDPIDKVKSNIGRGGFRVVGASGTVESLVPFLDLKKSAFDRLWDSPDCSFIVSFTDNPHSNHVIYFFPGFLTGYDDVYLAGGDPSSIIAAIKQTWWAKSLIGSVLTDVEVRAFIWPSKGIQAKNGPRALRNWDYVNQQIQYTVREFLVQTAFDEGKRIDLIGHSLGGALVLKAAQEAGKRGLAIFNNVVSLAAAISQDEINFDIVRNGTKLKPRIYFSNHDLVLSMAYRFPKLSKQHAIGFSGLTGEKSTLAETFDVTDKMPRSFKAHGMYGPILIESLKYLCNSESW